MVSCSRLIGNHDIFASVQRVAEIASKHVASNAPRNDEALKSRLNTLNSHFLNFSHIKRRFSAIIINTKIYHISSNFRDIN